jgi:hypothetical protein
MVALHPRNVLFVHGYLCTKRAFGGWPELLRARGYRVLCWTYPTWRRGWGLEDCARAFHEEFEKRYDPAWGALAAIAHSMGGLTARVWLMNHFVNKGLPAPVTRLLEVGVPRHGISLSWLGRLVIDHGLWPGRVLSQQMRAPSPFLYDLAQQEAQYADCLPQVTVLAGLTRWGLNKLVVGGPESDGVVPYWSTCAEPQIVEFPQEPFWAALKTPAPPVRNRRVMLIDGIQHGRPTGFFRRPRMTLDGHPTPSDHPVWKAILSWLEYRPLALEAPFVEPHHVLTRSALVIQGAARPVSNLLRTGVVEQTLQHRGLTFVRLRAHQPGLPVTVPLEIKTTGGAVVRVAAGVRPGSVWYLKPSACAAVPSGVRAQPRVAQAVG